MGGNEGTIRAHGASHGEDEDGEEEEEERERTPTEVRGLIDVPTFKVPDVLLLLSFSPPLARATLFIYLRHIQLPTRDRKTDCAPTGRPTGVAARARVRSRDRDSRRYLHANSFQARFRTRKNPHRDESGPRARARVPSLFTFDPAFRPAAVLSLSPRLPPPLRRSLLPPTWRASDARRAISRPR